MVPSSGSGALKVTFPLKIASEYWSTVTCALTAIGEPISATNPMNLHFIASTPCSDVRKSLMIVPGRLFGKGQLPITNNAHRIVVTQ